MTGILIQNDCNPNSNSEQRLWKYIGSFNFKNPLPIVKLNMSNVFNCLQ